MKIVLTGATSFLGLALTKQLLAEGHQVLAVVRPSSSNRKKIMAHPLLTMIEKDLSHIEEMQFENADIFFHMAWDGVGSVGRADPKVQKENIEYGLKAVKTAAAMGCHRFLFSGSQAEYGQTEAKMNEDLLCNPVIEYGKAKLKFGNEAKSICKILNMEYIHTRIFSVYGPNDHPWSLVNSCLREFQAGKEMHLSDCMQKWNFLYIEDAAKALAALTVMKSCQSCVVNVAGTDTRVLRNFIEDMYRLCNNHGKYSYGTRAAGAEKPVSLDPDITRLIKLTGWRPETSFEEGIRQTQKYLDQIEEERWT